MENPSLRKPQQQAEPMDIDPIDDGPRPVPSVPTPILSVASAGAGMMHAASSMSMSLPPLTKEEEAKQAIEQLRNADDMAQRVHAAHRLPAIAAVLGPERTRMVSKNDDTDRPFCDEKPPSLRALRFPSNVMRGFSVVHFWNGIGGVVLVLVVFGFTHALVFYCYFFKFSFALLWFAVMFHNS